MKQHTKEPMSLGDMFSWLAQGYINITEGKANTFEAESPFHLALQKLIDQADLFKATPDLLEVCTSVIADWEETGGMFESTYKKALAARKRTKL